MQKIVELLVIVSVIFVSCEPSMGKYDSNYQFQSPSDDSLKLEKINELNKSGDFEIINKMVYNSTKNYENYENFLTSEGKLPIKHDNTIFFDDIVFMAYDLVNKRGITGFRSYGNKEIDSLMSLIVEKQKPIIYALDYTTAILTHDYEKLAKIIGDNDEDRILRSLGAEFTKQDMLILSEKYFKNIYAVKLRSKVKIRERISDLIYIEFGKGFNEMLFDNWYSIVESEFNSYVSNNKEMFEKIQREVELGLYNDNPDKIYEEFGNQEQSDFCNKKAGSLEYDDFETMRNTISYPLDDRFKVKENNYYNTIKILN